MNTKGILVRDVNRKLLIQQLFNSRTTSRAEISRNLELNKSTISSIYNELDHDGFIADLRLGDSTKNGGRRPHIITLNKKFGWVVCFEIGNDHLSVLRSYLNGEIIERSEKQGRIDNVNQLLAVIKKEVTAMKVNDDTVHGLLGIGFSVLGIVFNNQISSSPFFNFENIDLQKYFEELYGVPVILENEANLTAVFERDFGMKKKISDLVAISNHTGVGAGIIADGQLYHGYRGMSGEIGRQLFAKDDEHKIEKVENLCSASAIIRSLKKVKSLSQCTLADVAHYLDQGDEVTLQIVDWAMKVFTWLVYNVIQSYGPQEVFISSEMFEQVPFCYADLKKQLQKLQVDTAIDLIYGSKFVSLLGASSIIIHRALGMEDFTLKFPMPQQVKHYAEQEK